MQLFTEATNFLGEMLMNMYGIDEEVVGAPIDEMLYILKEAAINGENPARLHARNVQDHWIFTAFQTFEDDNVRIWVGAGVAGPAIQQIILAINKFAEESNLALTPLNTH